MITADRPTTSGLQTTTGAPVQLGPSPLAQQFSRRSALSIPPAQWGNQDGREEGEEECELLRDPPQVEGDPVQALLEHDQGMEPQDELHLATVPAPSNHEVSSQMGPRCVNGQLVRPEPPRDDSPSTAMQLQHSRSQLQEESGSDKLMRHALVNHLQVFFKFFLGNCRHLHHLHVQAAEGVQPRVQRSTRVNGHPQEPRSPSPEVHQMDSAMGALGQGEAIQIIQPAVHPAEAEVQGTIQQEEQPLQEEDHPAVIHQAAVAASTVRRSGTARRTSRSSISPSATTSKSPFSRSMGTVRQI